ncbi:purine-nucleoside phosphorylase [Holzapfeliella floricola]|uniref:Purine nucleoside phosphorylase DeoD-type n=1 Tax=Holzapfeliella floricola DSM 23037 = JCM 16512 TaxID=1423744 RepID=A0A0R2DUF3_9LACO|nr:purine-nucleoside phosphorylase [Holzapfeliella floricola]KRN04583.1 purine nucleoside phosphorylase [Holzapfeliella floricola DSM 23037 = JCM 16512]
MATPHIQAEKGEIASIVLLPGDPLRAKFIAENFLEDAKLYNSVRNTFGYTGTYKGVEISVQATGMGMPSMSIYANELMRDYGVKTLIRVGTTGSIREEVKVRDIVISQAASTDSNIIRTTFGDGIFYAPISDFGLLRKSVELAEEEGLTYHVGNTFGEDRFYNDEMNKDKLREYNLLCLEMEIPALYMLAAKYNCRALGILTVSDHLITGEQTSSDERQEGFGKMVELALETAIQAS